MRRKVDPVNQSGIPASASADAATPAAAPDDGPADALLEDLHALMHRLRHRQQALLRTLDPALTPLEGKVLGFFARHPGATAGELVAHSGRDKGQLARLLQGLRERGLLQAQADAADRRVQRLALSPRAEALHQAVRQARRQLADEAATALNAAEQAQLRSLLQRLHQALGDGPAPPTGA